MTVKPRILVIEDDPDLNESITDFIRAFADPEAALNGADGLYLAEEGIFDAIILDIMLPELNGFDVLKKLRAKQIKTPVLILTAKDALTDKLHGFELGGDDYLTKPFHREELIMRLKALLKRTGHFFDDDGLTAGPFVVHVTSHEVLINDQPVALNGKEFDLLVYLLQNQKTIITKDQIFDRLWGFDSETAVSVVEVYMSNLRKKLKPLKVEHWIKTIRNVGYIFKEPEGSE
ncbi:response regulator transcription factor [Lacticaseibacillus paracasei]|uniref:response regulator transcription factor n=1 Tax=Lacticaseibacillus paracasei TaxID=1597 RepID=UPI003982AC52